MNAHYPRPHVYDKLGPAGKRLARIPRYGRLIATLPPPEFARLTTEADTLWMAYSYVAPDPTDVTGLLDDGLKATEACRLGWHEEERIPPPREEVLVRRAQVRLASDLLGALAFKMFCRLEGEPASALVVQDNVDGFLKKVFAAFRAAGAYRDCYDQPIPAALILKDWGRLKAMDSHGLKHFIFSASEEEIRWTDITTMAFFAAYWACRWAEDSDLQRTRQWVVDPLEGTNEVFREFWTFAAEMPEEALQREGRTDWTRYETLFTPLYDGTLVNDQECPIRSTEFIYRSWQRMAGTTAQASFLAEFEQIRKGEKGDERKGIAERMLAGLVPLVGSGKRDDTGTFTMGAPPDEDPTWDSMGGRQDNPQQLVTLTYYRLHECCVTNEQYELFEGRHVGHRWGRKEHPLVTKAREEQPETAAKADDRCPVVNVTWYDAWCFAVWCGCQLPTEAEWEYACRAGRQTPFTFGKEHDGKTCTADVCNFDGNSPWPEGAPTGGYRECTIPVDGLGPNRWGFYQLHGNVWEWCADWYAMGFYDTDRGGKPDPVNDIPAAARVLRGGGWSNIGGGFCRSAYRSRNVPDFRNLRDGFRLAAAPDVGAQQGK